MKRRAIDHEREREREREREVKTGAESKAMVKDPFLSVVLFEIRLRAHQLFDDLFREFCGPKNSSDRNRPSNHSLIIQLFGRVFGW